ncbi:MAG: BREX system ATP-binding domain-containing protein [Ardenticatenaceae bacterium]
MTLTQPLAEKIIYVLGTSGTPPPDGVPYFNVGNESLLNTLERFYFSSYLKNGGATFKMVVGDYGSGKSHFLYCLRHLAWKHNFAVAKVDLSPVETPYNNQQLVYAAVARNLVYHEQETPEPLSAHRGLTTFLEQTLKRYLGCDDLSKAQQENEPYKALVNTINSSPMATLAYKAAILAYFEALISAHQALRHSLERWLLGEVTTPEDTKLLRQVGVTGKIKPSNAFRMLRALAQIVRTLSYSGLILLFDEVDRMASIGGRAEKLATDNLREVIDRCRDDLPGAMFVYAVPPQFINDIVPRYPALQQRLRSPGKFSRINYFSPLISLEKLDLEEDLLMSAIGEKLIPIYEIAYQTQLNHTIQQANAAIMANVARDIFLDISHRRLFVKAFVNELTRQYIDGERLITEEEAIAMVRGQADELTQGETPPY